MSSGQLLFNPRGMRIGLIRAVKGQLGNYNHSLYLLVLLGLFLFFKLFFAILLF